MNAVAWMSGASVGSALVVAALVRREVWLAVAVGMVGPLLASVVSWVVAERTYRLRPESLTAVMAGGFAAKLLFFGVYVASMVRLLAPRHAPFVASFTSYLIGLYFVEALYLRRLFR